MKKENTILKLSLVLLELEGSKGHLKWKVTELEAKAKLSRSLIYQYLGSSKEEMLKNSLASFASHFYGFTEESVDVSFPERIKRARDLVLEFPEVVVFYQKWRPRSSWVQQELIKIEMKFQKKLKKLYPSFDDKKAWMVHAFLHGLVTAPFIDGDQTAQAAEELEKLIRSY